MKRPTFEEIMKAVADAAPLAPAINKWVAIADDLTLRFCPLATLLRTEQKYRHVTDDTAFAALATRRWSRDWVEGFISAYDDHDNNDPIVDTNVFHDGYDTGHRVRMACHQLFPDEP